MDVLFGKQQFVGKVAGSLTDHYQMLKVSEILIKNHFLNTGNWIR